AQPICDSYRMACFTGLDSLAQQCDAVFVHSSTASHFQVIGELLRHGVHVYVDKPLAETVEQGEQLIALAEKQGKALMVGFNRRFAPLYRQLKQEMNQPASIRMDKHRADSVGPHSARLTLLADYLHVIDTALWLGGDAGSLLSGCLRTNEVGELVYAEHHFECGETQVTTSMHRRAGSQRESVQAVTDGAVYQLNDMRQWLREDPQGVLEQPAPGWQTTLAQRGFDGAIRHFLASVSNQTVPETAGEQAIAAQRVIERLLRDANL
ncbi:MAG: Gfo/Idh/MocA family oxidoreductase, partial [Serratia liquefaciens]|nr:Gfo/Idh/MocA family oxidoreductase [Serratia liquefaciens]